MLIKRRRGWELPESAATPEATFRDRRRLIKAMGAGSIVLAAPALLPRGGMPGGVAALAAGAGGDAGALYPAPRNDRYTVERPITDADIVKTYYTGSVDG